jgi:hypothetical protein
MIFSLKERLSQLEKQLENLFEGQATRWIPSGAASSDLAYHLVSALNAGIELTSQGEILAPDTYLVRAAGSESRWLDDPDQQSMISKLLQQAGESTGLIFLSPVKLIVERSPASSSEALQVLASFTGTPLSQTAAIDGANQADSFPAPQGFFLIVNGTRRFDLDQVIVNIGRHSSNHLVIPDPGVSRKHAQLRYSPGGFMIFDLDSTAGTWVNGQRVQRCTLNPGDVIVIAEVPLVYRVDQDALGQTQSYAPE